MHTYTHMLGKCLCLCVVSPLPLVSVEVCAQPCVCVCVWVGFLSETSHPLCEVIRKGGEIWLSFMW